MSHFDSLIREHCPGGVPFVPLGSLGTWCGGGTPSKSRPEFWKDGTIPWVSPKDMGRVRVDSAQDQITEAAVRASATKVVPSPAIVMVVRSSILDHTFPTALTTVPVALNQDMKALVPDDRALPGYLAHVLRANGQAILRTARKTGGSVASIDSGKLLSFKIPVPPLVVQREIVRILDHFAQLEAELEVELEVELEARRTQYAQVRDHLLTHGATSFEPLGVVGSFVRGRRFTKDDRVGDGGIGAIHYGEIYTHYGAFAKEAATSVRSELRPQLRFAEQGVVVFAAVGETVQDVGKAVAWLGDEPVAVHDDCFMFRHSLNPKYVAYWSQTRAFHDAKAQYVARAKVKRLSGENLARIPVALRPLDAQERIVETLDAVDALLNDLSVGLPAELAARRRQYEYYRDKLLTFEEKR